MAQPHEIIRSLADYKQVSPKKAEVETKGNKTPEEVDGKTTREWGKEARAFIQAFIRRAEQLKAEEVKDADN